VGERSHLLLVNPSAGGGRARKVLARAEVALKAREIDYRVELTTDIDHACELARGAAAEGRIPVVISGDGLVGKVGGVLAGGEVPLAVIPGGRGNDFARVVGIPTEPEDAVALLAAGTTRRIDVGEANGERFLCIASCGFDSDANRIANEAKVVKGPIVYAYAALRALAAWQPAGFTVDADGDQRRFSGFTVAVANSKAYGGGMMMAPDAVLDDGLFDVVMSSNTGKLRVLANMPKIFKGTHVENPEVEVIRAREVEISADRPFAVYADGEHITDLPAKLRLLPGALSVIAP